MTEGLAGGAQLVALELRLALGTPALSRRLLQRARRGGRLSLRRFEPTLEDGLDAFELASCVSIGLCTLERGAERGDPTL